MSTWSRTHQMISFHLRPYRLKPDDQFMVRSDRPPNNRNSQRYLTLLKHLLKSYQFLVVPLSIFVSPVQRQGFLNIENADSSTSIRVKCIKLIAQPALVRRSFLNCVDKPSVQKLTASFNLSLPKSSFSFILARTNSS